MLSQWHFWTAFFGTGALLVLLAWLGSRRRKLSPRQIAAGGYPAACGSCGYDLTGLPGHICPECGSDLDLVGRLSPRFHRWQSVPVTARLIVWTIVVGAIGAGQAIIAMNHGIGQRQRFIGMIQWSLRAPLTDSRGRERPMDYTVIVLALEARFERAVKPDAWLAVTGEIRPVEGTQWSSATIRVDRFTQPTITEDGEAYFWPGAAGGAGGSSVIYLEPDAGGKPRVSDVNDKLTNTDSTLQELLALAIEHSGYGGKFASPAELAAPIAPSAASFLQYGAPTQGEAASDWFGNYHGVRKAFATTIQPPEVASTFLAAVGGIWFLIWICGLPFILRKRPMSIRREAAEGGGEGATPFGE